MATAPNPKDDLASLVSAALFVQQNPPSQSHPHPPAVTTTTHPDPDYPAESFRLPPEAELEWLDRSVAVAAIYERDDSTKGTANPKAHHGQHQNQNQQPQQQQHGSNRFSGPLKPRKSAILGLPKSIQRHSGYLGAPRKGKGTAPTRIFPKKRGKAGKAASGGVEEPGSPKVSCFGKVRSERERCREEKRRMRRELKELEREEEEHVAEAGRGGGGRGGGFWSCLLMGPMGCCRGNPAVGSAEEDSSDKRTPSSSSSSYKKKNNNKQQQQQHKEKKTIKGHRTSSSHDSYSATDRGDDASSDPQDSSSAVEPPGLGGLKRFASGRRSSSWGGGEFEANGEQQQVVTESGRGGVHADASSGPVAPARRSVG